MNKRLLWLPVALSLMATGTARAHDPGLSVATARWNAGALCIHLAMARTDVERVVTLDANHDGHVSDAEFQSALPALRALAHDAFQVTASGNLLAPAVPLVVLDSREGLQFEIPFQGVATGAVNIQSVLLEKLPRGHREFLSIRDPKQNSMGEEMLDAARPTLTAQLSMQPCAPAAPHSFRQFLGLGIEHIATGYDHLLFLFGLLIVGGSLRSALQIITSFTVAHSITLALATLNIVNIPPKIIEPMIAASIVVVGVQNLFCRGFDSRWILTFCFGLIHGCGFASALRDLGIGSDGGSVVVPLVSFNAGVELGQLAIAALILPLMWKFRASPAFARRLVPIGSCLVVLAGSYWLLERTLP